ncbi:MAG: hypothetical protein ABFD79_00775 [Phycisphaerales bacterium]
MPEQNSENNSQNIETHKDWEHLGFSNLLFPNVFKTFVIAIQPGRILTAFLVLALIFLAGWIMDLHKTVIVSGKLTNADLRVSTLNGSRTYSTELHCYITFPDRIDNYYNIYKERTKEQRLGVFKVFSNFCVSNFNEGTAYFVQLRFDKALEAMINCFKACVWVLKYHTIYGIIFLFISFISISLGGGAICRGAALHFTRDERSGAISTIKFAIRRCVPLFFAPTSPIALAGLLGLVIVTVLGLITNIPYAGEILLALFFVLVLICGLLMAFAAIWGFGSVNLIYSAIAFEKTDTFDSMCRAYTYVFSRPWRLVVYTLLAALYGGICYLFVRLFGFLTLLISRWFLDLGVWAQSQKGIQIEKIDAIWPMPEYFNFLGAAGEISKPVTQTISAAVVNFEILVISGLVMAFAISFYFSASTIIYALLRNKVDKVPLDNVYVESVQTQNPQEA